MRKVTLILAITLVFLVGETIVLKQNSLATGTMKQKIVFWIPIDQNCNVVFDQIKPEDKIKFIPDEKDKSLPINFKGTIHKAKTIGVIKTEPNPVICFWIVQEGVLKEK